jgi:L-malate glycosyltransferase
VKPVSVKLRVCHLAAGDAWAGTEAHLVALLPELSRMPGVEVHAILMNDGLLAERLRQCNLRVSILPESHLSAWGLVRALSRLLQETPTDLLHTHGYKQNVLGAIAARFAKVALLVRTEHGAYEPLRGWAGLRMGMYSWLDFLAARGCSAIIAVSDRLSSRWRSVFRGRRPKVVVVRNGVPIPPEPHPTIAAQVRARLGIGEDRVLFGTLARMVPIKGLGDLLEAAALLRQRGSRAVFVLAGDGPLRPSLEARAAELHLDGAVRFLGFTSESAGVLAALDVFVLPSLDEGVPLALLEALAAGKPVVATAVGGMAELLSDRVNALLVPPSAPRGLAEACDRLERDAALRTTLGRQARSSACERLSAGRMAAEVYALYCSVWAEAGS